MHDTTDMNVSWEEMKQFPNERILVIADANNPPLQYIDILLKLKYNIIWVGCDAEGPDSIINVKLGRYEPKIISYPECKGPLVKEFPFSLQGLLNFINMDFSMILHFQNFWMPNDRVKSPVPYIYIPSETWYPKIPFCATATTYCNVVMRELIEKYHPNVPIIGFLPYPMTLDFNDVKYDKSWKYRVGFCGNLDRFTDFYKERREIVFGLKQRFPKDFKGHWPECRNAEIKYFEKEGNGTLQKPEYKTFLKDCLLGVSIPTQFGLPFRDIEIASVGRCPVTKKVRDHATMGFEENVHYLAFSDLDELSEIITKTKEEDALRIGKNAYTLVHKAHRSLHRVPLLEIIFEKFGLTPHAKMLGVWKEISEKKEYIQISLREDEKNTTELYIGRDIYYPVGIKYDQ